MSSSLRETVKLVFLKKPNKLDIAFFSYKFRCLHCESDKLFERVICDKLQRHLDGGIGGTTGNILDNQFGF